MNLGKIAKGFAEFAQKLYKTLSPTDLRNLATKVRNKDANSTGADDMFAAGLDALAALIEGEREIASKEIVVDLDELKEV